ncbi:SUN domain-containing protein 1 isoform X2 [Corythoichthys intestinalis]|uniref:SUN domain-containing protein 1 isoform X2 n=1 Tax=Corythoichthys intestinalis TaxID=161448 RepID=UPI0025A4F553|nr:SUN domain-containing protein 1 isoform X2 [Corythoichthys intestinalis]
MSRRSCRLASTGYYNSDDESDSSTVTNISYREHSVKVFKKKVGARKATTRATRANNSMASPSSIQSPSTTAVRRPSLSTQTDVTMGNVTYATPRVTARPSLNAASSTTSQTATRSPPLPPPERFRSTAQAVVYLRPDHQKEQEKNSIDSSGYSSSEGISLKPPTPTTTTKTTTTSNSASVSKVKSTTVAPRVEYRQRIKNTLCGVKVSLSTLTAKAKQLTTLANGSLNSAKTRKTCIAIILIFLVAACVKFLPPLLPPLFTLSDATKLHIVRFLAWQSDMECTGNNEVDGSWCKVKDTLPTDMEAKMQHLLEDLQQKQELLYKIKEQFEVDLQTMRDDVKVVESNSGLHLDREVMVLGKKMDDQKRDFHESLSGLGGRMKAIETQIAELSKELLSIQSQPNAMPCPDIPVQKHLTPELQQAMEKWLSDRIRNAVSLRNKGMSSSCAQPIANEMADFALETQGASVISTRCSETYRTRSACLILFGIPLWYPTESPRTVIRGDTTLLPGKCWAFHGAHGSLVIALSHPIRITHVTIDHVPRQNTPTGRIDSAPKEFAVYGMKDEVEDGTLLGSFMYDEDGEPTQTFELPPSDEIYRVVELRVISNWGQVEYTCLYRFRVHGAMATAT